MADILASRARAISRDPENEAVIIVARGPNEEADNRRWLADMASLTARIKETERFDAPKPVREAATAQLRGCVQREVAAGRQVLIVPLLISFGGIERGLGERLDGLAYTMAEAALLPDDRLATWVLTIAAQTETADEIEKMKCKSHEARRTASIVDGLCALLRSSCIT